MHYIQQKERELIFQCEDGKTVKVTDLRMISIFYILRHIQLSVWKGYEVPFTALDPTQILVIPIRTAP